MALYSFSHSKIGAAEAGKTFARLAYICREGAAVLGERHMLADLDRASLRSFAQARETMAGKNGRVVECFIAALPREGSPVQHREIVSTFCERLTRGQAPWGAAIHTDKPGNPHVHILAFDQNLPAAPGRGRPPKVMAMSRKGALEDSRALWAECHNHVMDGLAQPIDHRSFAAQGKAHLLPTVHEGPALRAMKDKGATPVPAMKPGKWAEMVDWPSIDEGRDRMGINEHIARINHLTTTYLEKSYGRPDRVLAAFAIQDGQVAFPGRIGLADGSGHRKADHRTARRHARPAGRGGQAGGGDAPAGLLAARLAALLGVGCGGAAGRHPYRRRRRGLATVGRYAARRLRGFESAVRRLITGTCRAFADGINALIGIEPNDLPRTPSFPILPQPRLPRPPRKLER